MSTDISVNIVVGFQFDGNKLYNQFAVHSKPKYKMEKRFDPRTGKEVEPERVCIREKELLHFDVNGKKVTPDPNKDWTDGTSLVEYIAKRCNCEAYEYTHSYSNDYWVVFTPSGIRADNDRETDFGRTSVGGPIRLSQIKPERFKRLKKKLQKLGLKPKNAEIIPCTEIS